MKLLIQIPCLNEREHLAQTFEDLPRAIAGIESIEVLVIDDGSTDGTADLAREIGVHHVLRFPDNRGLAAAFGTGIDACVRLGADVVVNTDADNQYRGDDIALLVAPLVLGTADVVIGDRRTDSIEHFSPSKRLLQRWGTWVVRRFSGTEVSDATSGFRALNRRAAVRLFIHNRFTYTLESIIQAGASGLKLTNVPIRTNPKVRESRLFKSIPDYLSRSVPVILRSYAMYRPVQSFTFFAALLFTAGLGLLLRFLYYYLTNPGYSGYVQSLTVGVGCVIVAFLLGGLALLSDLIATNRRLLEEMLARVRELQADTGAAGSIESTGAAPWRALEATAEVSSVPRDLKAAAP